MYFLHSKWLCKILQRFEFQIKTMGRIFNLKIWPYESRFEMSPRCRSFWRTRFQESSWRWGLVRRPQIVDQYFQSLRKTGHRDTRNKNSSDCVTVIIRLVAAPSGKKVRPSSMQASVLRGRAVAKWQLRSSGRNGIWTPFIGISRKQDLFRSTSSRSLWRPTSIGQVACFSRFLWLTLIDLISRS